MFASPTRILIAYPYWNDEFSRGLSEAGDRVEWILDSGAFTAFKGGKPIDFSAYCEFIEALPVRPERYFVLDVIGDPKATRANYEAMLARGLRPVPIFTRGEDRSALDAYYETSDVVAIGGLVKTTGKFGFVRGVMEMVAGRKVHWLGFNNAKFVAYYKPYMVDSSSWSYGFRFGLVYTYLGSGQWRSVFRRDFATRPTGDLARILDMYEVDVRKLATTAGWKNNAAAGEPSEAERLSARSWARYQEDVFKACGTRFYCAIAGDWSHGRLLLEGREWWESKKARVETERARA